MAAAQVIRSFTVAKAAQTITFATIATKTLANSPMALSATSSSGLVVAFASTTPAVCTVSGTTATFLAAGSCSITATQPGNDNYNAATAVVRAFTVNKNAQTITFASIPAKTPAQSPLALTATPNSGLTVTLASTTPTICTVSGFTATLIAAGTCSITASQAGDDTWAAATAVTRSFAVTQATQTITFATPSNRTYSATPFAITATASSGLPVTLASTTTTICTVATDASGTLVTMLAGGTCTITANQAGNTVYSAATAVSRSFTISKAAQTLTIDTVATRNVGDADFTPFTTNSTGLPVVLTSSTTTVCTVANNSVTIVATGTCTVLANAPATPTYNAATQVSRSFTVAAARAVQVYYVHPDQIGSPRTITSATTNAVVWKWDNEEAFGDNLPNEKPSGTGERFKYNLRFAGQVYDQETTTSYNYHRDYEPATGRYAQSDPIGLPGGISTYSHVGGNPLSYIDPEGLMEVFRGDNGVTFHSFPGPPAGGNEHARAGSGENYHMHIRDRQGREARMSTETWKPLTPEDERIFKSSPQMQKACESLTDGQKKFFDRVNREIFHRGVPTDKQLMRLLQMRLGGRGGGGRGNE